MALHANFLHPLLFGCYIRIRADSKRNVNVIHPVEVEEAPLLPSSPLNSSDQQAGYFPCKSGLRQGDPLSSYLFVISLEVLTALLAYQIQNAEHFSFHWRTDQMKLSHVIFADDLFLFCKGESQSINLLLDAVMQFSTWSSLNLSPSKCRGFFCNVPENIINDTLQRYGFSRGALPITYLGLPLITSRLNNQICTPLIQKICTKIDCWTTRILRYSGRLQLLNTVLQGVQGYWSMYLFLPKSVLKRLQSIFAKFLWAGNLDAKCQYKVAWSDCCYTKDEGGLGIRDLFLCNSAAILYQVWRLSQPDPTSLWLIWVHSCFLKHKAFWTAKLPYKCPWSLRKIFNSRSLALQFISYRVKMDSKFKAWHDPWLTNLPLIEKFGSGFVTMMDSTPDALVGSLIIHNQWSVVSTNDPHVISFRNMLQSCPISTNDAVLWNGDTLVNRTTILYALRQGSFFAGNLPRFEQNIAYLFTSVVIYLTWKERNSRIHGGQAIPASQLLTSVKRMLKFKHECCKDTEVYTIQAMPMTDLCDIDHQPISRLEEERCTLVAARASWEKLVRIVVLRTFQNQSS
nr:PREDICTED: uncharacterized protein LOC108212778 [Daucus carota subsp. sativus]